MNCGIYACICLIKDLNLDESKAVEYLNKQQTEKGISIKDICDALSLYKINVDCFYEKKVLYIDKIILYDKKRKHFFYLNHFDKKYVYINDGNYGEIKILRLFYPFIWPKYYIKIDN